MSVGKALARSGDLDASKEVILRAAEGARRRGAGDQLARAALAYGIQLPWGEGGAVDPVLVRLLEEASASIGQRESALHARVLARLATALVFAPDVERRRALAVRAVAMARRAGDPGALAAALVAQHTTCWLPDNQEERLTIADEVLAMVDPEREPDVAVWAHAWRLSDLLELGQASEAWAEATACRRIAGRTRSSVQLAAAIVPTATRATLEGRFDEAERLIGELAATGGAGAGVQTVVGILMVDLRRLQGRLEELAPLIAAAIEQSPGVPEMGAALALVLLVVNDGELDSPSSVGTNSYTTVTITASCPVSPSGQRPKVLGFIRERSDRQAAACAPGAWGSTGRGAAAAATRRRSAAAHRRAARSPRDAPGIPARRRDLCRSRRSAARHRAL